jgi:hypothetical protein
LRKRRIDAKARVIARSFLAGELKASETCLLLLRHSYWYAELFSEEDKLLLKAINSETDNLPVGKLRENWHPDFLPAKLEALAKYDAAIEMKVKALCERFLATMESRRLDRIQNTAPQEIP